MTMNPEHAEQTNDREGGWAALTFECPACRAPLTVDDPCRCPSCNAALELYPENVRPFIFRCYILTVLASAGAAAAALNLILWPVSSHDLNPLLLTPGTYKTLAAWLAVALGAVSAWRIGRSMNRGCRDDARPKLLFHALCAFAAFALAIFCNAIVFI